jgi:hypothetical protein
VTEELEARSERQISDSSACRITATCVQTTRRLLEAPLRGRTRIALDATGVGGPVVDLFKQETRTTNLYAITITGGATVSGSTQDPNVPKTRPDHRHRGRPPAKTPARRLGAARNRHSDRRVPLLPHHTTDSGHDRDRPASSDGHDDLLFALSLALWLSESNPFSYCTVHVPRGSPRRSYPSYALDSYLYR